MSARRLSPALVAAIAASLVAGCGRYVVIAPELVPSRNSRDWAIRHEPPVAGQAAQPAQAAPVVKPAQPTSE